MSDAPVTSSRGVPVEFDPFAVASEPFDLTEPQREMAAVALMGDEANCAYNQCYVLQLCGPLSPESLRNALRDVVRRHEALRLRIDSANERQEILPEVAIDLPLIDLSAQDQIQRDAAITRLIDHETHTPFVLDVAPLWRAQLLRETADRYRLVFTAHHLIVDGWSSAVVFSDLARSYAADRFGMPAALPPAASYRDFVADQHSPPVLAEMKAATEFWAAKYAAGVPSFELPLDHPRPVYKTYTAGRQILAIDSTLYSALRAVAAEHRATLFVALLAAFEVLMARLSSTEELVIGVPMASQALEDNGHLVAHGVNTIPLPCRVDLEDSFKQHLHATRKTFFDAQAHPRLTFGTLVRKLRLPRDPGRTPLVSVLFNIDKLGSPFDFGEVSVTGVDAPKAFYNFELGINAIDDGESLLLECDYNADLFKNTTIARWLSHYREMLTGIVADPRTPISQLPLLTRAETQQILVDWNATELRIDGDMRLHRLFETQAARSPHAGAIVTATERCSYSELNARANRLAHQLRGYGVGPEILVGVCLRRSVDLIAALLAVLKSGGAYVPLDPNYPADRIAFMLTDSQAQVVITTSDLRDVLPACEARVLLLDRNAELADHPDTDPEHGAQPDNLAYIIYTSGSTGVPKGVAIEHFSAATLVHWAGTVFPDAALRGVLASTSVCFDLSIFEIFFPLSRGGRVILAENALQLIEHPAREEVTLLNTVPSAMVELLRADGVPDSTTTVCLAGEPLSTRLVDQIYGTGHVREVYDLYGPSEDTTYSTWALRERGLPATIGRPIANTRAYVLDPSMNPVPIGVPGQLFLGGAGLARGYLNRPELTAERFMLDPFLAETGERIYRTGDLVRFRPDGNLEYLGRLDHQVKVRGFRIELGEVEAAIAAHPAVRDVAVIVREDTPGEKRLVAYVAAMANPDLVSELRDTLRRSLPEYMIPNAFVRLDALPLTRNGKLDRGALPDTDDDAFARKDYKPPQGNIEVALAAIWADLLGVPNPGARDNFFDLGGHSLLAIRMAARVEKETGLRLNLLRIASGTLRSLAAELQEAPVDNAVAPTLGQRIRNLFGPRG
ncbi:MAG: amino acid adenylation domain-containing protein [Rhodanobacteraceae bacterium]